MPVRDDDGLGMVARRKLMTRKEFRSRVLVVSLAMLFGGVLWVVIMRPGPLESALDLTCPLLAFFLVVAVALAVNPKEWRREMLSRNR